ncbi:MAG: HD domain-containing protein, partial [Parcubacteria group bacterium]|nr:HD domain-containing protein [Parcubacteria group bacterium]
VHDIGELITGDEITFTKKKDNNDNERKSALKILHPSLHSLYEEAENVQTKNAKFAKSIDKITPDILDVLTPPEITIIRYKHYTKWEAKDIVKIIKEHKHPYMTWNPFLRDFHLFLLDQLEQSLSPFYDKE